MSLSTSLRRYWRKRWNSRPAQIESSSNKEDETTSLLDEPLGDRSPVEYEPRPESQPSPTPHIPSSCPTCGTTSVFPYGMDHVVCIFRHYTRCSPLPAPRPANATYVDDYDQREERQHIERTQMDVARETALRLRSFMPGK